MTKEEILHIIQQGESESVEFKITVNIPPKKVSGGQIEFILLQERGQETFLISILILLIKF